MDLKAKAKSVVLCKNDFGNKLFRAVFKGFFN